MTLLDKLRFVRLMLRSFGKSDWSDWLDRSAEELVDRWGGPGVRRALFERLSRLKFDLPCREVSGAWLGARLHFREGSAPLGYVPGHNWTKVLCDGLSLLLASQGVQVRLGTTVTRLHGRGGVVDEVELAGGERIPAATVVSTIPSETYLGLIPQDQTPHLGSIRYTAAVSAICATRQPIRPDFYWMNLASLDYHACGLFMLDSLNPTIGAAGDVVLNFVTHVPSRRDEFFLRDDAHLWQGYREDFRRIFGFDLEPFWRQITRIPMYSPIFGLGYRNPPVRSASWRNVYFAGNYRTFPSIASTGTALGSGVEAAAAILKDRDQTSELPGTLRDFRLRGRPRR
jgi:protoporphyrinogen oxidase